DEVLGLRGVLHQLGDVAIRELLVDREPEVRELERDVRPQAFGLDAFQDLVVLVDGRSGLRLGSDALAEQCRVRLQSLRIEPREHGHGLVERLPGDETRRTEPEAVLLDETLQARALGGRENDRPQRRACLHPAQSRTMRSISARSSSRSPRNGARTACPTATPRSPSTAFAAAWN